MPTWLIVVLSFAAYFLCGLPVGRAMAIDAYEHEQRRGYNDPYYGTFEAVMSFILGFFFWPFIGAALGIQRGIMGMIPQHRRLQQEKRNRDAEAELRRAEAELERLQRLDYPEYQIFRRKQR